MVMLFLHLGGAMNKYWDINTVLSMQRLFNFINGPRSIGKTYTLQKWLMKQAIQKRKCTMFVYRTHYELTHSPLFKAFQKVLVQEFPEREFRATSQAISDECGPLIYATALSQVRSAKLTSYPDVHYMMFDEYQIESGTGRYLNGADEPELFITLWHTIDREENRVRCFFLGNNISYYNPYHSYEFFGLPKSIETIKETGGIWTNRITYFELAGISDELACEKENNVVLQSLEGSNYGRYAITGDYRDDDSTNILLLGNTTKYMCTLYTDSNVYALYNNFEFGCLTFSSSVDNSCSRRYALCKAAKLRGVPHIKDGQPYLYKLIKEMFYREAITYTDMRTKTQLLPYLQGLI